MSTITSPAAQKKSWEDSQKDGITPSELEDSEYIKHTLREREVPTKIGHADLHRSLSALVGNPEDKKLADRFADHAAVFILREGGIALEDDKRAEAYAAQPIALFHNLNKACKVIGGLGEFILSLHVLNRALSEESQTFLSRAQCIELQKLEHHLLDIVSTAAFNERNQPAKMRRTQTSWAVQTQEMLESVIRLKPPLAVINSLSSTRLGDAAHSLSNLEYCTLTPELIFQLEVGALEMQYALGHKEKFAGRDNYLEDIKTKKKELDQRINASGVNIFDAPPTPHIVVFHPKVTGANEKLKTLTS